VSFGEAVGVTAGVVLVAILVGFYAWVYRRNRARGTSGLITRSRLVCPKCGGTFDFDYLPGASVTALRLGTSRYMACPLCSRWSVFELRRTQIPANPPGPG
jgi:hypothetical protein